VERSKFEKTLQFSDHNIRYSLMVYIEVVIPEENEET